MSIINIKQAAILHGSSLVLGFLLAVIIVGPVGDHHVFRGKNAEIEEMRFCSMMRYLDAPVMFMELDLSVIIFCDHLQILRLHISCEQKVQLAVNGVLECQADLMAELTQGMTLFFTSAAVNAMIFFLLILFLIVNCIYS